MIARILGLMVCALLVASCGYHLQGSSGGSNKLFSKEPIRISVEGVGHYESFRRDLVSALRSYGLRVVKPKQASMRLVVIDKKEKSVVAVVGDNAKVREYMLLMKIRFTVEMTEKAEKKAAEKAEVPFGEQSVQIEVPYLNNPDDLLVNQKLRSAARMYGEEQLIRGIIDRLASFSAKRRS